MRITQEADYAIRICAVLDAFGKKAGAAEIAAKAGITQERLAEGLNVIVEKF